MIRFAADEERLAVLFSDLIRVVRGLEAANSKIGVLLGTLQESSEMLFKFCNSQLSAYTVGGVELTNETAPIDSDALDLSDDEPEDFTDATATATGKKRKPKQQKAGGNQKQRRFSSRHGVTLTPRCAYLVGGLILSLKPTLKDNENVLNDLGY